MSNTKTARQVLEENALSMEELMDMDYKDVAAHESAVLEDAGFDCPHGY